ncbi:MAG: hypothetical protein P7H58_11290 [Microcoleus anatoxicus]
MKLWNITTGKEILTLQGIAEQSVSAPSCQFDSIKLWNITTGRETTLSRLNTGSPDGTLASGNDTIKLWDITTGEKIHTLNGHSIRLRVSVSAPMAKPWLLVVW